MASPGCHNVDTDEEYVHQPSTDDARGEGRRGCERLGGREGHDGGLVRCRVAGGGVCVRGGDSCSKIKARTSLSKQG